MTMPPFDDSPPPEVWMSVTDVFHIKGRGTVITGQLEGNGQLKVGDIAVCDGMRWTVKSIEMFRAKLVMAEPGQNIGVLLSVGPPGDMLRNRTVQFGRGQFGRGQFGPGGSATMGPQLSVSEPRKKRWRR